MTIRAASKRVDGTKKVLAKYRSKYQQVIAVGGQLVMNEAKSSIQEHRSACDTRTKYNPRRTHTASAEKNPPNSDTGYLANNIYLVIDEDGLGADVESRAEYRQFLEFGTSKMTDRPFLQPALEANRGRIIKMFARVKAGGA